MEQSVLDKHYNTFRHFKACMHCVGDIELVAEVLYDFSGSRAIDVLSYLTTKYKNTINEVGKLLTNIVVIHGVNVYENKTEQDLIEDLYYISDIIKIWASVAIGLEPSVPVLVNKIMKENGQ